MPAKKQDKTRYRTSQLLNFARDSYLERTSRPVYALVYLLPFIIFYEIGTIWINTDILNRSQIRVVAFVWLQELLNYAGFSSKFTWVAAPLAVLIILTALQLTSRTSWKVNLKDTVPMAVECVMLAVPLIVLSLLLNRPAYAPQQGATANSAIIRVIENGNAQAGASSFSCVPLLSAAPISKDSFWVNAITGVGAGIYEELIFRLILICVLMLVFQDISGMAHTNSMVLAVLISAAFFSAYHHIDISRGRIELIAAFSWAPFLFRTIAGVYFAGLFAVRGFGITAGTHAFYDILAAAINAFFFTSQT